MLDAGAAHGDDHGLQAIAVVALGAPILPAQDQDLVHDGFGLEGEVLKTPLVQTAAQRTLGLMDVGGVQVLVVGRVVSPRGDGVVLNWSDVVVGQHFRAVQDQ